MKNEWILFGRNRKKDKWIEMLRCDSYEETVTAEGIESTQFDCPKYTSIKHISVLVED